MTAATRPALRVLLFHLRFAAPIHAGTKCQTIRDGTRARPGDLISPRIWLGRPYRSSQWEVVAPVVCTAVTPLEITVEDPPRDLRVRVGGDTLTRAELCEFVRRDGFASVPEMADYYREKGVRRFEGVLIQWEPKS